MGTSSSKKQGIFLGKNHIIFISVGQQLPFDRLLILVDNYFKNNQIFNVEIFAQIGNSSFFSPNIRTKKYISEMEFIEHFKKSNLIISHGGMGNIIKILEDNKSAILMPRIAENNEHRNNHQISTLNYYKQDIGLNVAFNESELHELLDNYFNGNLPDLFNTNKTESLIFKNIENYIVNV